METNGKVRTIAPIRVATASRKPLDGGASYPLSHRIYRAIWSLVWNLFARWTPPPFRPWRIILLRLFGARIHSSAKIYGSVDIWFPANLTVLEKAALGPRSICYCMDRIVIGRRAIVSQGAYLCGGTHDISDENFQLRALPIVIEDDAWVAAEAYVGPGVTVGKGAVLGARGVTFRDLDPWSVYLGNPAVLIKSRHQPPKS